MTAMARANYVKKKFYAVYKNLDRAVYDAEKRRLQAQLLNLQLWAIDNKKRVAIAVEGRDAADRKSTRLKSSHTSISYAVFCLKKKKKIYKPLEFQYNLR